MPSFESPVSPDEVVEGLKNDLENPAVSGPLARWLEQGESTVTTSLQALEFGVQTDMLYHTAGYSTQALYNLENERWAAQCEGNDALESKIEEYMDIIDA